DRRRGTMWERRGNPDPGFRDRDFQTRFQRNSSGPNPEDQAIPAPRPAHQRSGNRKTNPRLLESQSPGNAPTPIRGLVKSQPSFSASETDRLARGSAQARPVYEGHR